MGWDAHAEGWKAHKGDFEAASERVAETCGSVDGFLAKGGLDCSACASVLNYATGYSAYDEFGWSSCKVRAVAKDAIWPDPDEELGWECWAVESAREFLEICAKHDLDIWFSF